MAWRLFPNINENFKLFFLFFLFSRTAMKANEARSPTAVLVLVSFWSGFDECPLLLLLLNGVA